MDAKTLEWLKQADYDMDTAEFMARGGRYFYAVFLGHLALEKALLRGSYTEEITAEILTQTKEALAWIKSQF